MCRISFMVIVILTAAVVTSSASAGPWQSPPEQLSSASKEFAGALKQLGDTLGRAPAKVEVNKWTTIKAGAIEIQTKVVQLRSTIEAAQATADELGIANGRLQGRLDAMIAQYNRLADEAGAHAEQLSEPLASTVRREQAMWAKWAGAAGSFKEYYVQTLEGFEKQTADLKIVSPILVRMQRGAAETIELASIGERLDQQIETLATMADELNAVITSFGSLADNTRAALTQLGPRSFQQTAGLASANPSAYRPQSGFQRTARTASRDAGPYRLWRDNLGRPLRARMIGIDGDKVKLQVESTGSVYSYPVYKLSNVDQAHLRFTKLLTSVATTY